MRRHGCRVAPDGAATEAFDVVILGGGPAGCATALALAGLGELQVLVVERGHHDAVRVGESIPPDTRVILEQLGIWDAFLKERHEPCLGSCASWGADELGYNDFLFNPMGNGWHLDRRRFDDFLACQVGERGVALWTGTRWDGSERTATGFRLRLCDDDGGSRTVTARFVVDATGARASFARGMGASRLFVDQLLCVTGFFALPESGAFSSLTMLEAVEYGWWYAAKLPDRKLAVAVASDPAIVKQHALRRRDGWLDSLMTTRHIAPQLAGSRLIDDSPIICAAPSFVLDKAIGTDWLAVGDAAAAYDPISSQGIYKALTDGARAAKAIAAALHGSAAEPGDYQDAAADRFRGYLANRNYCYGLEQRWPRSAFWTRRQAKTQAVRTGDRAETIVVG
jgi:flavin-dependent dehydrogenase